MSSSDASFLSGPSMGDFNPPDSSNLPVDSRQAPPDPSANVQPPPPSVASQTDNDANFNAQQPAQQSQGQSKPSLWRSVLAGALTGLAASSNVNGRGVSGGSAFASGLAAGTGASLAKPAQDAANSAAMDQEKAKTALMYANLAAINKTVHEADDDEQADSLKRGADIYGSIIKSGAGIPISQPASHDVAMAQLTSMHAKNPWQAIVPYPNGDEDKDGNPQYVLVQHTNAPLQAPMPIDSLGDKFAGRSIPAGTSQKDAGQFILNAYKNSLSEDAEDQKQSGRMDLQTLKGGQAASRAASKPTKTDSNWYVGSDAQGNQIAGNMADLTQANASGITKLDSDSAKKAMNARQMISPDGLFHAVAADVKTLTSKNMLGVAASRWNDFMSGTVGDGPEFQQLRTDMGLLSTKLMQIHVGARGSAEMLEHFKNLANYSISDPKTLNAALAAEYRYAHDIAMLPKLPKSKGGQ